MSEEFYQEEIELINLLRLYRRGYPNTKWLKLDIKELVETLSNPAWTPQEEREDK